MSSNTPIPCFICLIELTNVEGSTNQPHDGVEFTSYGHYGSTFFDPIDGSALAINVCDACLADREGLIGLYQRRVTRITEDLDLLTNQERHELLRRNG